VNFFRPKLFPARAQNSSKLLPARQWSGFSRCCFYFLVLDLLPPSSSHLGAENFVSGRQERRRSSNFRSCFQIEDNAVTGLAIKPVPDHAYELFDETCVSK
jgi:hypothetical protein